MTQQATLPPVTSCVTVKVPIERAYAFFTRRFSSWWPRDKYIGEQAFEEVTIEPFVGGRCFERAANGTECDWGRVLAWEPPHRFVFSWQIDTQWQYEPDITRASEVEVTFVAEGPSATRVELVHRHIERHGLGASEMRAAISSPGGWPGILGGFRDALDRDSKLEA